MPVRGAAAVGAIKATLRSVDVRFHIAHAQDPLARLTQYGRRMCASVITMLPSSPGRAPALAAPSATCRDCSQHFSHHHRGTCLHHSGMLAFRQRASGKEGGEILIGKHEVRA